ncbi:uncharacterized protein LOC135479098 [Liolophura sinensis]|uniref:uncharacterized protein LOC135479098 n=1 Tax=Liolophura sinensis TaxID=3198878 RepID=UPI003158CD0C
MDRIGTSGTNSDRRKGYIVSEAGREAKQELGNLSPVGFCRGEIRSRKDSFDKRGTLKTHKATIPKKGQIKLTAMDYEMENPTFYDKPTVDDQNIEKKQRKRRPRTESLT